MQSPSKDQLPAGWQRRLPGLLLLFGSVTFLCGLIGLSGAYPPEDWTAVFFEAAGLLILDHPQQMPSDLPFTVFLGVAHVTGVMTAALGIVYLFVGVYRESVHRMRLRQLGRGTGRHAVVFGLGRVGRQLVEDLCVERNRSVVAIEINDENPQIEECRNHGATVILGDARNSSIRQLAQIRHADDIFIFTGDDAVNLEIAEDIRADLENEESNGKADVPGAHGPDQAIKCYTNVLSPTLAETAEESLDVQGPVAFHVFNTDENAARNLLLQDEWGIARTSEQERLSTVPEDEDEVGHHFVFGFGWMGQTVALQMARLAHFPNQKRLRLSVVDRFESDPGVRRRKNGFLDRYPGFCPENLLLDEHIRDAEAPDAWSSRHARPAHEEWKINNDEAVEYAVNAEFLDLSAAIDSPALLRQMIRRLTPSDGPRPKSAVVLCFETDQENFEAALRLRSAFRDLYHDGKIQRSFPLYAYMPVEEGLRDLLGRIKDENLFPIYPFGRVEKVANYEQIAQTDFQAMGKANHDYYQKHYGGPDWEELPPSMKASNEDAAAHGDVKLDALGWTRCHPEEIGDDQQEADSRELSPEQIELLAQIEHNRWMGERLSIGWRYGEKNPSGAENKRRTTFCAWKDLTDKTERSKDENHVKVLTEMYQAAGYVVVKSKEPE